jgi:hypothetical protein
VAFSPDPDFYAATAQVIPLLLLALVFEVRLVSRLTNLEVGKVVLEFASLEEPRPESPADRAERERLHRELLRDVLQARIQPPNWVLVAALVIVIASILAEAVALVALTLSDPPDALAGIVLAGIGALLVFLTAGLVDAVSRQFGGRDRSEPWRGRGGSNP